MTPKYIFKTRTTKAEELPAADSMHLCSPYSLACCYNLLY